MKFLLTMALAAPAAAWMHGWRDQYIRVSPQITTKLTELSHQARRLGESFEAPAELKQAARDAVAAAERVFHAKRHNDEQAKKPAHQRRKLMDVSCEGRTCTVNGNEIPDMSLWDCPWQGVLHPYLNLTELNETLGFGVDGGLCLPYQEIPFPYATDLTKSWTPVPGRAPDSVQLPAWLNESAPTGPFLMRSNIVCPTNEWNPDLALCKDGAEQCEYPGDKDTHGGATGIGENYGCAAAAPGWPSSSAAETSTPICKTWVNDCTYSKKPVRKYQYGTTDGITEPNQGYSIDWVLSKVNTFRNSLCKELGAAGPCAAMDMDLNRTGYVFPEGLYEALWGKPAGTDPPTDGYYPHAFTKGLFTEDGVIDEAQDGECGLMDAAPQWMDCGIPCPVGPEARMAPDELTGFGAAVLVFMGVCALLGAAALFFVGKSSERFFVGGRTLNIFVVTATLASQSLDSNAALGNIDLGYKYHWWDGACLPLGLGLSLVLNGIFFAKPLNEMRLLTLPDLFARKFGPATEALFSILAIVSFCCLLGGNLVGSGRIIAFIFGLDPIPGIWITTAAIWLYTVSGGLISVAYTDCLQALVGWTGLVVGTGWIMTNMPAAAGISPAYPMGDVRTLPNQMTDPDAIDPIPNAIFFNWVTIFVLGFGNLAALDFQARVFSAKGPKTAVAGCIMGGIISWIIGMLFSNVSGAARALYGPSSPYAEFVADSCSKEITVIGCFDHASDCGATVLNGVPTCGEWKPDEYAPIRMLTCTKPECHYVFDFDGSALGGEPLSDGYFPMDPFIGGWILIGIVAASMSTGDGAILAMSTVFAHNLLRKLPVPFFKDDKNLLIVARLATILWAPIAAAVASASPGTSGYLLIVAFDIMLAGSVVPMFAAVYWKGCKPYAAFISMLGGSILRLVLEFALSKDYLLLLVGKYAISFGPGAYAGLNIETGEPWEGWCPQYPLMDYTGLDSLVSPAFSLLLLIVFQCLPFKCDGPMFTPVPAPTDVSVSTGTKETVAA